MGDFFKQTYVKHFIWTQIQALIAFVFFTYLLILGTDAAWQIYHWILVLFLYISFQFFLVWQPETDQTECFNVCNIVILIFCLPVFLYYYFAILMPAGQTTDLSFQQVEKCVVSGISKTSLDGNEAYSLTYVNFMQNGNSYLGSGCLTNEYQAYSLNPIPPYKIMQFNDTFECGPGIIDYPKGNPYNNTNITDVSHRERILRAGGSGGHSSGGHSSSSSSHSHSSSSSREKYITPRPSDRVYSYDSYYGSRYHPYPYYGIHSTCQQQYTFSQIKIPTWLCSNEQNNFKDLITPKTCWVHFYNQETGLAVQNSKNRLNQRELKELAFVTFEYPIYYPKRSFNIMILFTYYPLILALNSIFQYTANTIVLKLYNEDNQAQTDKLNYQTESENQQNVGVEMPLMNQQ